MAVAIPTKQPATIPTRKHSVTSYTFQVAKNNTSASLQGEADFNSKLKCCSASMHSNVNSQSLPSTHFLLDKYNINSTKVSRKNSRRNVRKDLSIETQSMIGNGSANGETILRTVVRLLDRSTKWVLLTAVVSIVVWRHDSPEVLWAVTGCILNEGSSKTLKQIINQPRPASAIGLRKDPGMPSSHAQNLAFVTTYALFILIGWQGLNTSTLSIAFTIIIWAISMAWVRVLEGFHTHLQVMVGVLLGSTIAIAWFWIWKLTMLKMFDSLYLLK